MNIRYVVLLAIVAAMVTITAPASAQSVSTTEQVQTWSLKKWNEVKAEISKDKAKWSSCRQQNKDKKLKGRASWSFLYDCVKA
jgi:hypothetical protein